MTEDFEAYERGLRDMAGMAAVVMGEGDSGYEKFDRWLDAREAVENEEHIRAAEKEIARLVVENARLLAIIDQVRIYAIDRAHYGRGGRVVGSARIASDLQEILNPRRMDEQS